MTMTAEQYIEQVIDAMPRATPLRAQIAMELRGHIAERVSNGQPLADVIVQLGDPGKLAESYLAAEPLIAANPFRRLGAKILDVLVVLAAIVPVLLFTGLLARSEGVWVVLLLILLIGTTIVFFFYTITAETKLKGDTKNEIEMNSARRVTHLRLNIFPDGGVARFRVHGEVVAADSMFTDVREIDLAAMANGGYVVECSDMHYGHRQNLILPGRSIHMGDGWETKRRRGPGNDWTIVRLARRGTVERIELDTDHFKGNAPGSVMLEASDTGNISGKFDAGKVEWRKLVSETPVQPHTWHHFNVADPGPATHVRLNIYPDGGVARLRLFGRAV